MTFPTCEQKKIVHAPSKDLFVKACPGAGKTRVIAERFLDRVKHIPKNHGIALLSFTNSAADQIRECCAEEGIGKRIGFPNFVGTLDSFISTYLVLPFGMDDVKERPQIIESWDSRGFRPVRIPEISPWPLSLDALIYGDDGLLVIDLDRVDLEACSAVESNLKAYQAEARRRLEFHRKKGYISCTDARHLALQRIRDPEQREELGKALAGRFTEILLDEAQDCNDEDLEIIAWLRDFGVPTIIVCDPDQAIFEFRTKCSSDRLEDAVKKHLECPLTGNFRSTSSICKAAATLRKDRPKPDVPLGEYKSDETPVYVLPYPGKKVLSDLGEAFRDLIDQHGCSIENSRAIAHKTKAAARSVGVTEPEEESTSTAFNLALAVSKYRAHSSTGPERLHALHDAERVILMRLRTKSKIIGEDPEKIGKKLGISDRWLRSVANSFLSRLPLPHEHKEPASWVEEARDLLAKVPEPSGILWKRTAKQILKAPNTSLGLVTSPLGIPYSSIHKAKGQQFEAVMFVIPPQNRYSPSKDLISNWQQRKMKEPNRVAYVAITRAQKVLLIAVPRDLHTDLCSILQAGEVSFEVHTLSNAATDPPCIKLPLWKKI